MMTAGFAHAGTVPFFPPLLKGERVALQVDPLAKAVAAATAGIDAGTIFWSDRSDRLELAIVLTPETELRRSMTMVHTALVALADSIGALAPPEVGVTWSWPDDLKLNGGHFGTIRAAASTNDPDAQPDWLVLALSLQVEPFIEDPGRFGNLTSLHDEGCGEMSVIPMIESWSRHFLVWLNRWEDEGFQPIYEAWRGRAEDIGETIAPEVGGTAFGEGLFLGLDEDGGMLFKSADDTRVLPLTLMLAGPREWAPEALMKRAEDNS